jgi:hypothetical protein
MYCTDLGERKPAIILLYDINFIIFITETDCVYCAVRTESVSIIKANVGLCLVIPWFWKVVAVGVSGSIPCQSM